MKTRQLVRALERYEQKNPESVAWTRRVRTWVGGASEEGLWRINAFHLADHLGVDRTGLLEILITLTFEGLLELNWDFHCTQCNAVAGTHHHLQEVTSENHCPLCDVDFRNDLNRNVEVTFTPSLRYYTVGKRFLDRQLARTIELHRAHQIRLPEPYVRGIDCLHVTLFRERFDTETLALRESLRISQVGIMFTDIKGSTALYDRLGDSAAYGLVRSHFEVLFRKIKENGGVVVKTIGDSVMASFTRPEDGVKAALAIQEAFRELNVRGALRNEILVKVGLHAGGTIMVNLNNRLDYFGQTVNLAARVQSSAGGGEVVITGEILSDRDALAVLRREKVRLAKRLVELKGIRGSRPLYRLLFDEPQPNGFESKKAAGARPSAGRGSLSASFEPALDR